MGVEQQVQEQRNKFEQRSTTPGTSNYFVKDLGGVGGGLHLVKEKADGEQVLVPLRKGQES
jgi:hypothetical protein